MIRANDPITSWNSLTRVCPVTASISNCPPRCWLMRATSVSGSSPSTASTKIWSTSEVPSTGSAPLQGEQHHLAGEAALPIHDHPDHCVGQRGGRGQHPHRLAQRERAAVEGVGIDHDLVGGGRAPALNHGERVGLGIVDPGQSLGVGVSAAHGLALGGHRLGIARQVGEHAGHTFDGGDLIGQRCRNAFAGIENRGFDLVGRTHRGVHVLEALLDARVERLLKRGRQHRRGGEEGDPQDDGQRGGDVAEGVLGHPEQSDGKHC